MAADKTMHKRMNKVVESSRTALKPWTQGFMHISKPTELYITKGEMQCMQN